MAQNLKRQGGGDRRVHTVAIGNLDGCNRFTYLIQNQMCVQSPTAHKIMDNHKLNNHTLIYFHLRRRLLFLSSQYVSISHINVHARLKLVPLPSYLLPRGLRNIGVNNDDSSPRWQSSSQSWQLQYWPAWCMLTCPTSRMIYRQRIWNYLTMT